MHLPPCLPLSLSLQPLCTQSMPYHPFFNPLPSTPMCPPFPPPSPSARNLRLTTYSPLTLPPIPMCHTFPFSPTICTQSTPHHPSFNPLPSTPMSLPFLPPPPTLRTIQATTSGTPRPTNGSNFSMIVTISNIIYPVNHLPRFTPSLFCYLLLPPSPGGSYCATVLPKLTFQISFFFKVLEKCSKKPYRTL